MLNCSNIVYLVILYIIKIILALSITMIPLVLIEIFFIKAIKEKSYNFKLIMKSNLKLLVSIFSIFIISLTVHNSLKATDNTCYNYINKDVFTYYKETSNSLNDNISKTIQNKYLENMLAINYNNYVDEKNKEIIDFVLSDEPNNSNVVQLSNNKTNNNFLKENDSNKLNNVYVVDGVFYYPRYVYGNWNTYSGTSCPSNPINEGYNNPYGYNNYFYTRLTKFIEDASKNGYKITMSTQGCRTYQTQVNYYNTMERGRAASPGYSLHGFGIASDLEFYQNDGSVCGWGRTASSCPSMGWAHQNAYKYGLVFPLLNASYKEDWHIEPISKVKY